MLKNLIGSIFKQYDLIIITKDEKDMKFTEL